MKSKVISSFSNLVRLKLLVCLAKGEKNVTQLIGNCDLSQSAVSQHLEKLRTAGFVKTEKRGKEVYYALVYPKAAVLSAELLSFIEEIKS
jgi:ArsR family transcriptional regulator